MKKGYYESENILVLSDGTILWRGQLYEEAKENINNTITGDISDLKELNYIDISADNSVK